MNAQNRIVHVPRRFVAEEWGGTETVILQISKQQQRAGLRPVVATSMALARRQTESVGGVPVERHAHCYPFFGLSASDRAAMDKKGGNLLSLPLFWALMRMKDVRLFHAHALKRLGGEVRTAARLRRKPFVVSLHGGVFDVPAAELESMVEPIRGKHEWGKAFGALFGSRRLLEDADHVICVGEGEMERARTKLGHDRITYLPNGVDTAHFAEGDGRTFRARHGIASGAFVVLNIGRIDAQKNQLLLLQAFLELRRRVSNAVLVMAGPETQPEYAAKLRAFIAEHGLEPWVRLLPALPHDSTDLVAAFHAADVFVLPSRHEPFGIVALEAWSARLPVIASRVGGLRTLIPHGRAGWLFDHESPAAVETLADMLRRMAEEPELRRTFGYCGRHLARRDYDWSTINTRLEEIYQAAEAHCGKRK